MDTVAQAGGVKLAKTRDESILASEDILPMTIHKHKVSGVLVAEAKNILHEYYVSISVDRSSRDFDVLATANGGTEVEEIAKEHPESVKRLHIDALDDFDLEAATKMAESIGFYHADVDQAAQILLKMWRCFKENDATLVEINPLAKSAIRMTNLPSRCARWTPRSPLMTMHRSAMMVGNVSPIRFMSIHMSKSPRTWTALCASQGSVGVIGNGAGLVMSSLDAVSGAGEDQGTNVKPANFLDIGGGASAEVMSNSLEIVLSDPQVESVLINVYGGITSCEQVAKGILEALDELGSSKPIVVRFDGNAAAEGLNIWPKPARQPARRSDHGGSRTAGRTFRGQGGSLK